MTPDFDVLRRHTGYFWIILGFRCMMASAPAIAKNYGRDHMPRSCDWHLAHDFVFSDCLPLFVLLHFCLGAWQVWLPF
ncbi:hypothetical protein FB566_1053 [Stackebrandtia endophytica]|uniref:Uncharacterized protein n=1 Tax=Stackebrandtia endophytica TaxID=1496996 RepID=A0A543ASL8_9ACTN|nr:hypothetical protein FB566_1053 [Stackebrandtia endophytica]